MKFCWCYTGRSLELYRPEIQEPILTCVITARSSQLRFGGSRRGWHDADNDLDALRLSRIQGHRNLPDSTYECSRGWKGTKPRSRHDSHGSSGRNRFLLHGGKYGWKTQRIAASHSEF